MKCSKCNNTSTAAPTVGSIYSFAGIWWRVLTVQGGRALLITEKIIEKRPYNDSLTSITWEQCTLRRYLNNDFYNKLGMTKSAAADTRNLNPNNPWYGTTGGNVTTDKIFLLSLDEVVKYFGDSGDLAGKRRKDWYGKLRENGEYIFDQYNTARIAEDEAGNEAWWWWLRSPGYDGVDCAAAVDSDGSLNMHGFSVFTDVGGVRPALWLNL